MIPLLLSLLLAQEPTLSDAARAFAKGDDAPRARLLAAGPGAVLAARKARELGPARIDALVLEIKLAMIPRDHALHGALKAQQARRVAGRGVSLAEIRAELPHRFRVFADPMAPADALDRPIEPGADKFVVLDHLQRAADALKVDWGYYHGHLVLAPAERLWPVEVPPPPAPLAGEAAARARKIVEQLGSEMLEDRDAAAAELARLGLAASAQLEEGAASKDVEIASRCRALLEAARRPPAPPVYHPSGVERQKLRDDDAAAEWKKLGESQNSFRAAELAFGNLLQLMLASNAVRHSVSEALATRKVNVSIQDSPIAETLVLLVQSLGGDLAYSNGELLFDSREAIERLVGAAR